MNKGLAALVVLVACQLLPGSDPVAANTPQAAAPAAGSPGAGSPAAGSPAAAQPVMRRLTEAQYRATVADIFDPGIPVVGRFERALRSDGLIAVGTSESGLSPFSVEQYDASARGIAAAVLSEAWRDQLLPCQPAVANRFDEDCATRIVEHFGRLLFRRPLSDSETGRFLDAARNTQQRLGDFYSGLEFALVGMMISPDFLLRIERVEPDPAKPGHYRLDAWSRATRLSYFITGSTPDDELLRAAGAGELDTEQGLAHQVERLMASPRFANAVRVFFDDMLQFELFDDLAKDPVIYPSYNSAVAEDAREQTLLTITDHLLTRNGDYRDLFTTRSAPLTRSLGVVYRMPVATRNGWAMSEFSERSGRAGIQSQVGFLALHSHPGRSSPTLRGKAIREVFLCQHVPDPPVDVDFTGINDDSNAARPTARDRLEAHRTQPACKACHTLMDPLGLTLERFDGVGGFRTRENGAIIDVSGSLDGREFEAAPGLGQALHDHPETPRCLVSKLYRSAVGRKTVAAEKPFIEQLNQIFADNGYRLPGLMQTIAVSEAFYAASPPSTDEGEETVAAAREAQGDPS